MYLYKLFSKNLFYTVIVYNKLIIKTESMSHINKISKVSSILKVSLQLIFSLLRNEHQLKMHQLILMLVFLILTNE
jgi:hypothetical protein